MTTRELMDNLYETLMWDERILSPRERELLVGVLNGFNPKPMAQNQP